MNISNTLNIQILKYSKIPISQNPAHPASLSNIFFCAMLAPQQDINQKYCWVTNDRLIYYQCLYWMHIQVVQEVIQSSKAQNPQSPPHSNISKSKCLKNSNHFKNGMAFYNQTDTFGNLSRSNFLTWHHVLSRPLKVTFGFGQFVK